MVRQLRVGHNVTIHTTLREGWSGIKFKATHKITFLKDQKFKVLQIEKNEYNEIKDIKLRESSCKTKEEYNRLLLFEAI